MNIIKRNHVYKYMIISKNDKIKTRWGNLVFISVDTINIFRNITNDNLHLFWGGK